MISKNALSYLKVAADGKEQVNMFLDVDIPGFFAAALESNEAKTISLFGGLLRSMGIDITPTNELVMDMQTFD